MVVATQTTVETAVTVKHVAFTTDQFEQMIEAAILTDRDRVELIEGAIVDMAAIGMRHVYCVMDLQEILHDGAGKTAYVLTQSSFRLGDSSEPQPDFTVIRRPINRSRRPTPPDIFFVIEVSDSALAYDRGVKLPLYGAAGIPEAWIFDLIHDQIERHTDPYESGYRTVLIAGAGEKIPSLILPNLTFDVDTIFTDPEESDER